MGSKVRQLWRGSSSLRGCQRQSCAESCSEERWGQSPAGATTAGPAGPGAGDPARPAQSLWDAPAVSAPPRHGLGTVVRGHLWGWRDADHGWNHEQGAVPVLHWTPAVGHGGGSDTILRPPPAPQLPRGTQQQEQRGSISPGPASRE